MRFVVLNGDLGDELPVFTDWAAVKLWPGQVRAPSFVILKGPGAFVAARKFGAAFVVINPDGPIGLRVNKAAIATLADGHAPAD